MNSSSKIRSKIRSDKELTSILEDLLEEIKKTERGEVITSDFHQFSISDLRLSDGELWHINAKIADLEQLVVTRIDSLLESAYGSPKEVSDLLWSSLSKTKKSGGGIQELRQALADKMSEHSNVAFTFVGPNHAVLIPEGVTELSLGPVQIARASEIETFIEGYDSIRLAKSLDFQTSIKGGVFEVGFPQLVWIVETSSSRENVETEARWLINVIISLLRLEFRNRAYFMVPSTFTQDPPTLERGNGEQLGMTILEETIFVGGKRMPEIYNITKDIHRDIVAENFQDKIRLLFHPKRQSMAERFVRALGWFTRGRQVRDRSEKFLMFFTALESIFTSDDKTSPVVDTIARRVSVLLSNDHEDRFQTSKLIKKLYGTRSSLVHSGNRNASAIQTSQLHNVVEETLVRLLYTVPLDMSFNQFETKIRSATYGAAWSLIPNVGSS